MNEKIVFVLFFTFLVTGCASYQNRIASARIGILNGNCGSALDSFEKFSNEKSDDRLLYLLEYGSALQICGDYNKSSQVFIKADKLSEDMDYHSLSNVVGATLLNEEMVQYKADFFEKFLINAMNALNFLELGRPDDALVEARRINEKFLKLQNEEKKNFELNSFSQYISGLIWESTGKIDDACISYKEAFKLDRSYYEVGKEALRACALAKRKSDFDELVILTNRSDKEYSDYKVARKNFGSSDEVTIIFLQGMGPKKVPRPRHSVYPMLKPTFSNTRKLKVSYLTDNSENVSAESKSVYSVERAAIATLEADFNSLGGRRFGARIAKEVVADQIRQKDKNLGNLAWFLMVASERADLRNWTLLPESIQIVRVRPKLGTNLILEGLDSYGSVSEQFSPLKVNSRSKKIFLLRAIK